MATTISQSRSRPLLPDSRDQGWPAGHALTNRKSGSSLSDATKDALYAEVSKLQSAGASLEEIRTFVDSELESNGVDLSAGARRSGQLIDMMS